MVSGRGTISLLDVVLVAFNAGLWFGISIDASQQLLDLTFDIRKFGFGLRWRKRIVRNYAQGLTTSSSSMEAARIRPGMVSERWRINGNDLDIDHRGERFAWI